MYVHIQGISRGGTHKVVGYPLPCLEWDELSTGHVYTVLGKDELCIWGQGGKFVPEKKLFIIPRLSAQDSCLVCYYQPSGTHIIDCDTTTTAKNPESDKQRLAPTNA
jgi:hypothetical protein